MANNSYRAMSEPCPAEWARRLDARYFFGRGAGRLDGRLGWGVG